MTVDLDNYYLTQPEPNRGCLLALRKIILQQGEYVTETKKYGMPCFCYKSKAFCYLWTDKKAGEPYILFVEGRQLDHPALEKGDRTRMKILRVNPTEDLPLTIIKGVLKSALAISIKK